MNRHDREIHKYWIETLETEALDKMDEWELDFLTEIRVRVDNKWDITDKQESKLESIYTKYTK